MKYNDKLIRKIEKAIGMKLWDEQKEFLKTGVASTDRKSGMTLVHMIDLALDYETSELDINRPHLWADMGNRTQMNRYAKIYRNDFLDVRWKLKNAGFKVIPFKLTTQKYVS